MADPRTIKAYHRRKVAARCAGIAFGLAYTAVWCWLAPLWLERLAPAVGYRWPTLLLAGAVIVLIEWCLLLPLTFYTGYVLEHRYDLSNETWRAWFIREFKELAVGAVLGAILLSGLYGLLWYGGTVWWLWVWVGWLLLSVGLTQLFPVLILPIFYKSTPIENEALIGRLKHLAENAGLRVSGVYKLDLSSETKKPNAMLTGLGRTRRVLLSDTLLEGFTPDEIVADFVHELGHQVRGHIWKGIALSAAMATLVIAGIVWRLGPYAGDSATAWKGAVAALPQILLLTAAIGLILRPLANVILCRFETACDRDALQATGRDIYRSTFLKLADKSLSDPTPPRWVEILFYDHPPISKRLAIADAAGQPLGGPSGRPEGVLIDSGQ